MDTMTIKGIIRKELPILIESDSEIRNLILDISKNIIETKADKDIADDKFNKILAEMQKDREEQAKKWDKQAKKWDEQAKKWDEQNKKWFEQNKKLDDQNKKWDEQNKKWFEQNKKLDEQNKKWFEQNKQLDEQNKKWFEQNKRLEELIKLHDKKWQELHKADDDLKKLIATTVGVIGARWGRDSEASFRNALKGILENNFDISVVNYNEYDENGEVFGYPDQVELDIIIRNGLLIICEIKSSMSNSEMYTFYKKSKFYEKQHNKTANSYIAISPMISDKAKKVAEKFGINVYTSAYDVDIF